MKLNVLSVAIATVMLTFAGGCGGGGSSTTGTSTSTSTSTSIVPDPAIVNDINLGASTAIALGLTAIPDATEATNDANLANQIITSNILPVLNGDNAGLISGISEIMNLSAFDSNPALSKVKMIIEVALPLLQNYLPSDLTSNAVNQVNPAARAYLIAFFSGVQTGINNYLAGTKPTLMKASKDFTNFADLRKKLAAKI